MNKLEWADKLLKIANAISETVYSHELEMSKYARDRKVSYDDMDYLRQLSRQLRIEYHQEALAKAEAS